MSAFDSLFRNLILTSQFVKGWGQPKHLKRLLDLRKVLSVRDAAYSLVDKNHKVNIFYEKEEGNIKVLEGEFHSPWDSIIPGVMPNVVKNARFQMILPHRWQGPAHPICIHHGGTGDHGYLLRRRLMAEPLLSEHGIGSIIIESPFYGTRKPKDQFRSSLQNVSDLIVMGGALMFETVVLLHWCEEQGWGPFCLTGISMGGFMSSLAATIWPKPIALVPCLAGVTASPVYTRGILSKAVRWDVLKNSYYEDKEYEHEIRKMLVSPERGISRFSSKDYTVQDYHKDVEKALLRIKEAGSQVDSIGTAIRQLRTVDDWKAKSFSSISHNISQSNVINRKQLKSFDAEILDFMWEVMEEFTHLGNYSSPVDTSIILSLVAESDAYIPRDNVMTHQDLWPGSKVKVIPGGHVSSVVSSRHLFRQAIVECLEKHRTSQSIR
ncbi:protein ABHD18-like [Saccostrea echinata]|uniref:protein ABHD18-like n=1 Tax=Saccostrea echinata TaxID=191078 RepID=UPI002A82AD59|nr:protein ABHD18-like [Saccostrea echinata]XP_061164775.1 protein ABHD18-like [Saccostrea echinata]